MALNIKCRISVSCNMKQTNVVYKEHYESIMKLLKKYGKLVFDFKGENNIGQYQLNVIGSFYQYTFVSNIPNWDPLEGFL